MHTRTLSRAITTRKVSAVTSRARGQPKAVRARRDFRADSKEQYEFYLNLGV